jgi:hypothetical protein
MEAKRTRSQLESLDANQQLLVFEWRPHLGHSLIKYLIVVAIKRYDVELARTSFTAASQNKKLVSCSTKSLHLFEFDTRITPNRKQSIKYIPTPTLLCTSILNTIAHLTGPTPSSRPTSPAYYRSWDLNLINPAEENEVIFNVGGPSVMNYVDVKINISHGDCLLFAENIYSTTRTTSTKTFNNVIPQHILDELDQVVPVLQTVTHAEQYSTAL